VLREIDIRIAGPNIQGAVLYLKKVAKCYKYYGGEVFHIGIAWLVIGYRLIVPIDRNET